MAQNLNHAHPDLSIYKRVLMRLPFLSDTPDNERTVSGWVYETMWLFERCFKAAAVTATDGTVTVDETRIGLELNYSVPKQSLIADITAVNILTSIAAAKSGAGSPTPVGGGEGVGVEAGTLYVKKAKAGDVETEFAGFNIKESALMALSPDKLLQELKSEATRKGASLGCFGVFADFVPFNAVKKGLIPPFGITGGGCCGC